MEFLADEDDPLTALVAKHALKPLLNALPAREQNILLLRFYGNLTQRREPLRQRRRPRSDLLLRLADGQDHLSLHSTAAPARGRDHGSEAVPHDAPCPSALIAETLFVVRHSALMTEQR
ncbi:hypothetical protein OHA25_54300 [Nonomuraea sp. NBC_00507]|uniref:hypothetical protein n=1 Tax=Nonomuraea sp. NBC_00507 TaxID=2976002 RepID=UPI002E16BECC